MTVYISLPTTSILNSLLEDFTRCAYLGKERYNKHCPSQQSSLPDEPSHCAAKLVSGQGSLQAIDGLHRLPPEVCIIKVVSRCVRVTKLATVASIDSKLLFKLQLFSMMCRQLSNLHQPLHHLPRLPLAECSHRLLFLVFLLNVFRHDCQEPRAVQVD